MNRPPMIDTITRMREKAHLLDLLSEIDVASKFMEMSFIEVIFLIIVIKLLFLNYNFLYRIMTHVIL
jgi:hypothetical protein